MSAAFLASALIQFALGLVVAWILGPAAFGLYALALSAAMLLQTLLFDWVRLGITRYAGESGTPFVAKMNRAAMLMALVAFVLAGAAWLATEQHRALIALVPLVALAAGGAEILSARLRARFAQKAYAAFSGLRALLAIVLLPLACIVYRTPEAAVAAYGASLLLATLVFAGFTRKEADATAPDAAPEVATARRVFAYSWPIILTNLAYLALFFALRAIVARDYGLAASGQFSLALDFALKIVMTLGTALDVYLFQIAVREAAEKGRERARLRLAFNAEIVLLVLAVALVGTWVLLPSLEMLMIAPAFRQAFAQWFVALAPGLLLYGLVQYALHPFSQIEARTTPVAIAGLASVTSALFVIALVQPAAMEAAWRIGAGFGIGMAVAFVVLAIRSGRVLHRPLLVIFRTSLVISATALFGLSAARMFEPGLAAMLAIIAAGAVGALGHAWLFDAGFFRTMLRRRGLPPV